MIYPPNYFRYKITMAVSYHDVEYDDKSRPSAREKKTGKTLTGIESMLHLMIGTAVRLIT